MSTTIQPVIMTPDLERLQIFYTALLGAEETSRVPDKGPTFFVGLRVGDAELGLVADEDVQIGTRQRMLLSVDVENPDDLLGRVEALG